MTSLIKETKSRAEVKCVYIQSETAPPQTLFTTASLQIPSSNKKRSSLQNLIPPPSLGSLLRWRDFFLRRWEFRFWEFACIFLQLFDSLISRKSTLKGRGFHFRNKICKVEFLTSRILKPSWRQQLNKRFEIGPDSTDGCSFRGHLVTKRAENEIKVEICKKRP